MYGLAYGAGFSAGPLGLNLLPLGLWVPFGSLLVLYAVAFVLLSRMKNEFPDAIVASEKKENKYAVVLRCGWLALIPSFLYGYMETSLNGSFPIYALRSGISLEWVSLILPSFVVGSIILQMPLGTLSDRVGRKRVMTACALIGGAVQAGARERLACIELGLTQRTLPRWRREGSPDERYRQKAGITVLSLSTSHYFIRNLSRYKAGILIK